MNTKTIETGDIEPIEVLALNSTNGGITGLTINLKIRSPGGQWFDFSTSLYRDSTSVVSFTTAMTEVDTANDLGRYKYIYDSSTFAPGIYQFRADNTAAVNFPQIGELTVKEITAKRLLDNKFTIDSTASTINLWDDSGSNIIRTWALTDISSNSININDGPPSNRGVPST